MNTNYDRIGPFKVIDKGDFGKRVLSLTMTTHELVWALALGLAKDLTFESSLLCDLNL